MKYKPSLEDHFWFATSLPMMLYFFPIMLLKDNAKDYKVWLAVFGTTSLLVAGFFFNAWFGSAAIVYVFGWTWLFVKFGMNTYPEHLYYKWFMKRKPFVMKIGSGRNYFEYKRNGYLCHHYFEDNKRMKKWEQEDDE